MPAHRSNAFGAPSGAPRVALGIGAGAVAYSIWGLLAVYFLLLRPAGPYEISSWRIVFSLPVAAMLVAATRRWVALAALLAHPRLLSLIGLGAYLLVANWLLFVIASTTDRLVDASLGYFINPVVTALVGVIVLRERLRPRQWLAIGIVVGAIVEMSVSLGTVPWLGIMLAITFALYSLVKHLTAHRVDPISGFATEVMALTPVAVLVLLLVGLRAPVVGESAAGLAFGSGPAWQTMAFTLSGIVTAVPLLLFATASQRLPLAHLGLLQFFTPVFQFLTGFLLLHEPMPPARWVGFGLVWVALGLLVFDLFRHHATAGRRR